MEYVFIIFAVVFFLTLIILLFVYSSHTSNVKKSQTQINEQALKTIKNTTFQTSKIFYLNDCVTFNQSNETKKMVLVDNINSQLAFIDYKTANLKIVNFNDILNYEVYENGASCTSGNNLGVLFGGIWGGLLNAETHATCKDLRLIIRLNSLDTPHITYDIVFNNFLVNAINKTSKTYSDCISTLQEFVSFLEVIKSQNKTNSTNKNDLEF